jgi:hypothetical protein
MYPIVPNPDDRMLKRDFGLLVTKPAQSGLLAICFGDFLEATSLASLPIRRLTWVIECDVIVAAFPSSPGEETKHLVS